MMTIWLSIFVGLLSNLNPTYAEEWNNSYIGTLRWFNGTNFNEKGYYASIASADYYSGEQNCWSVFRGFLVAIESEEEELYLNKWIEERGNGGSAYMTSGYYDEASSSWKWHNGNQVQWYNWAKEQPEKENADSRIVYNHLNQFSVSWKTSPRTSLHRFICEYRR